MHANPTMEDLRAIYQSIAKSAKSIIESKEECLSQLFFICPAQKDGEPPSLIAMQPDLTQRLNNSPEGKNQMVRLISAALRGEIPGFPTCPACIVTVNEVWCAAADPAKDDIPPSEREDRTEGLLVTLHTLHAEYACMSPIDATSRKVTLVDFDVAAKAQVISRRTADLQAPRDANTPKPH